MLFPRVEDPVVGEVAVADDGAEGEDGLRLAGQPLCAFFWGRGYAVDGGVMWWRSAVARMRAVSSGSARAAGSNQSSARCRRPGGRPGPTVEGRPWLWGLCLDGRGGRRSPLERLQHGSRGHGSGAGRWPCRPGEGGRWNGAPSVRTDGQPRRLWTRSFPARAGARTGSGPRLGGCPVRPRCGHRRDARAPGRGRGQRSDGRLRRGRSPATGSANSVACASTMRLITLPISGPSTRPGRQHSQDRPVGSAPIGSAPVSSAV